MSLRFPAVIRGNLTQDFKTLDGWKTPAKRGAIAHNPAYYDAESDQWITQPVIFFDLLVRGRASEHLPYGKGDAVVITGDLVVSARENDDKREQFYQIDIQNITYDPRYYEITATRRPKGGHE